MELYTLHFDGSCGPKNPGGTAAYGYVLEKEGQVLNSGSGVIGSGPAMTNNLAEFAALAEGFTAFLYAAPQTFDLSGITITVLGDSRLVINMMNGKWKPDSSKRYYPGYDAAKTFLDEIRRRKAKVNFDWIPREQNTRCDELSKEHNEAKNV